jgi:tetratricopeptide (TPR) repeat protein
MKYTATNRIQSAFDYLQAGDTEKAIEYLDFCWRGIGVRPPGADNPIEQAERLLLVGILTSKLGAQKNQSGAQEAAKDMLNEAQRLFAQASDPRKDKAQIELALCYWRCGEMKEAMVVASQIRSTQPTITFEALLTKALLETESGQIQKALATLSSSIEQTAATMPAVLRAQFHYERAVALRRLDPAKTLDRSLIEYEAALVYYEEAESKKGEAMVLNNLASIYRDYGSFTRAHIYAERTVSLFTQLGSKSRLAEAHDQRATIFLAEHNNQSAERAARQAVNILESGDQKALLARSLITLGQALARSGKHNEALDELERAAAISEHIGDPAGQSDACLVMIEELNLPPTDAIQALNQAMRSSSEPNRLFQASARVAETLLSDASSTLADLERHFHNARSMLIARAMKDANGSISRAATALGISHRGLAHIILTHHPEIKYRQRHRSIMKKSSVRKATSKTHK